MPQDILDPKDERDLAKEREIKPLKGGNPQPPSSVPTMGEAEPTAGSPAPAPQPMQEPGMEATGASPMQQQTPSQMVGDMANQLMFSTPSFQTSGRVAQLSGEEVRLQKDPLEIVDQGIQEQLGQLTPQAMFQGLQRSSYTPQLQTELPDDWEDKQDIVERAIGDVKVKNMNITQAHQYGYNPANVGRYGVSNAPALDTDLASRGLSSELGKAIEDKLTLDSVLTGEGVPVIGNIGGLWRDVTKSVLGIGLGAGSWIESKMPDWYKNKVEAVRKKLGIDDDLERIKRENVQHLQQQTTPGKFDPTKTSFGDYGTGGTGALLYALNVIPSAVMGGAYDLIDAGRELAGADELYAGSRTLDAFIKGKDWGLSNQWSEEKYLSLQEPEELRPGQLTGNPYWDLPEKVSQLTGLNTRAAHWLIQAPLAIAGEALIDIPADRIAAKLGSVLPRKVTPAARIAEEAVENSTGVLANRPPTGWTRPEGAIEPEVLGGEIVKYVPQQLKPDEFVRTEVVKPKNAPEQVLYVTPNGQVRTTIKDENGILRPRLPNGLPSYADVVNTKPKTVAKLTGNPWADAIAQGDVPVSALSLMRRSDAELSELARLMPSPLYKDNRPLLPPASRIPTSNELKALELTIPEFKRYGSVTELVPSGVYEVAPPQMLRKPQMLLESAEDAMKRRSVEAARAIEAGNVDAFKDAYRAMEQTQIETALIKARHLDSMDLYDVIKKELPVRLQTDNVELYDEAQIFLQSDFNIAVLGNRKRQVEGEISLLNDKIKEIDAQLQVYGDLGRGDITVVRRTEGWSDDALDDDYIDELSFDVPEQEPGQILTDITDPQEPQDIDFGTPQKDAEMLADDITQTVDEFDDYDPEAAMYETRDDIPFGMDDEEDPYAGFYGTDDEVDEFGDEVVDEVTPDVPEDPVDAPDDEIDDLTFDLPEETTAPSQGTFMEPTGDPDFDEAIATIQKYLDEGNGVIDQGRFRQEVYDKRFRGGSTPDNPSAADQLIWDVVSLEPEGFMAKKNAEWIKNEIIPNLPPIQKKAEAPTAVTPSSGTANFDDTIVKDYLKRYKLDAPFTVTSINDVPVLDFKIPDEVIDDPLANYTKWLEKDYSRIYQAVSDARDDYDDYFSMRFGGFEADDGSWQRIDFLAQLINNGDVMGAYKMAMLDRIQKGGQVAGDWLVTDLESGIITPLTIINAKLMNKLRSNNPEIFDKFAAQFIDRLGNRVELDEFLNAIKNPDSLRPKEPTVRPRADIPDEVTLGGDDIDDLSADFDESKIPDIEDTREIIGETTATERIDSMKYMSDLELTPDEDWNYIMGYVTQILKDNDGKWNRERYLRNIASEEPVGDYDEALIRALAEVPDGATADDVRRVVDSVPQPKDWEAHLEDVKAENAKALEGIRAEQEARRAEYRERGRQILGKYADYVNLDDLLVQHEKFEPFIKKVLRPTLESIEDLTGGWIPRVDITSWESRSAFRPEGAYDNAIADYVDQLPDDYIGKVSFGMPEFFMEPGKWDRIKAALYHEIGHAYEYAHPKYRQWATEYRQWLVDNGFVIDASDIDHVTQDSWTGDKWLAPGSEYRNPYVGRTYPNGSTEVVSTIFEYFSDRDTTIYFKTKNPTLYELGVRMFEDASGKPFNVNDIYPKSRAATVLGRGQYEAADAVGKGMKQKTTISGKYLLEWEDFAENKRWLYGTPNPVLIENMDYMKGGSTSELGFGVYLTTDKKMAAKSATKFPMSNQPENLNRPDKFAYRPTVYEVNPGMLGNVMDLNQPIPKGNFRKMLEEAAKFATGDKAFAPHVIDGVDKIAFIWNKFRENYLKYYGKSASEGVVRKYYEYIANSFKNWNIDAGLFSNNGVETLIVYNPKNLVNRPTPPELFLDPVSQANITEYRLAAQQYIDSQVLRQFGDDVSKVNWLTSNRDLAEWLKRKHQKSLAEIQADLMDEIRLNMNAEEALRYGVEDEVYKTIESFKENLDTRTVQEFNIDTKKISDSPCPPMTSNFFKLS